MNEFQTSPSQTENQEKRSWQTPSIEELDFSATEAAYIGLGAIDLGIYSV